MEKNPLANILKRLKRYTDARKVGQQPVQDRPAVGSHTGASAEVLPFLKIPAKKLR